MNNCFFLDTRYELIYINLLFKKKLLEYERMSLHNYINSKNSQFSINNNLTKTLNTVKEDHLRPSITREQELLIQNIETINLSNFQKNTNNFTSKNINLVDENSKIYESNSYTSSLLKSQTETYSIINSLENDLEYQENNKKNKKIKEKTFVCKIDGCFKKFNFRWILERHLISHYNIKNFKCTLGNCGKAYKSMENLTLHIKNKHFNQKPYKCSYCNNKYSHRNGKLFFKF